jgi:hypothetical protein
MNLAFGALLIFILLFPGSSFRSAYLGGPYTRKASATSFIDELIWSLAPAFVLQFLGYFFVESVLGQNISERVIYHLLTASPQVDFAIIENSLPVFSVPSRDFWRGDRGGTRLEAPCVDQQPRLQVPLLARPQRLVLLVDRKNPGF